MKQEDKELLLKDLSTRLPYHPYVVDVDLETGDTISCVYPMHILDADSFMRNSIETTKPYLRPMSSMTEEEGKELEDLFHKINNPCWVDIEYGCVNFAGGNDFIDTEIAEVYTDWLNKKMFDYRGLIEKGLALEAPEGMYKFE